METEKTIKQLLYLYNQQTNAEQMHAQTEEKNSVGFNGADAGFCSSVARWVLSGNPMTTEQQKAVDKILVKYQRQLSNNAWQEVPVPAVTTRDNHRSNILDVDPQTGALTFYPAVYPSKQICKLGAFYWTGKIWKQLHANISGALVKDICKMFPSTEITDTLQRALEVQKVKLSAAVEENMLLYPFQKEAIEFMVSNKKALLGLAPGLGKSACAIYAAQEVKAAHVLIISPLSLMYNWQNEIKKWVGENAEIIHKKDCPVSKERWTITNYDTIRLHQHSFDQKWDCVIVDETILIKNRKALRTKAIKSLLTATKPEYVWFLSGAPISRLYDDLWAQLNSLLPGRFTSYWRFAEKYCYVEQNQWGWQIIANRPEAAAELQSDLSDVYFSRTQDQVLNLPDWIFDDIHIRMEEGQDAIYGEMEDKFVAELGDGLQLLAPNVLAQMTRLIQLASNPALVGGKNESRKWESVADILEYEKLPAIIWTRFVKTADMLQAKLSGKWRVGILTGDSDISAREETVEKFQQGELDVLIAHPGVGKFGFTLTAAKTAIYLERSFNGDDYYQSLHRVRRIGTVESPHVIHLISDRADGSGTVDNVINNILKSRRENVIALTQGELKNEFENVRKQK